MELVESIECVNESGQIQYVDVYQHFTVRRQLSGATQRLPGSVEYFVAGKPANQHGKDAFKLVLTDEVLRRAHPATD